MALNKIKFTSESAWSTEKKLNDNFSEIELEIQNITGSTKTKLSQFENDGDGTSPFATEEFVTENGGKIDSIKVNGVEQSIDNNKSVNIEALQSADVVDNVTSTDTTKPLSANQGRVLKGLIDAINTLLQSDDVDLDTLQEVVNYIKDNKDLIDSITTSKVNVADIVDNLTSQIANRPLSANQGFVLKSLIDGLQTGKQNVIDENNKLSATLITGLSTIATSGNLADATQDATHQTVTAEQKTIWTAKQDAIASYSFTAEDVNWSAVDSNGFFTLTIASSKKPFVCYNSDGEQIMAGLKFDGTNIYVVTDTKLAGTVYAF